MLRTLFAATSAFAILAALPSAALAQSASPATQQPIPMSAAAQGSARTGPNRIFTGEDLFDLAVASDPQISPDGASVAYVRRQNDIMADRAVSTIWMTKNSRAPRIPDTNR